MGRLVKRVVQVVLVLLVGSAGIVAALAYLPFFAAQRQLAAEQLLERFVDRPVSISGDVVVVPGAVTSVDITGITIGAAESGGGFKQLTIDDAAFGFQLVPALRGDFEIEQSSADGIVLTTPPPSDAGEQALPVSSFFLSFAALLESRGTRDLQLHDFSIVSDEDPDGWAGAYKLTELVAKEDGDTGDRVIKASGTINGKAAKIDATFAAVADDGRDKPVREFSIATSLPGYEGKSSGTMNADGSGLDGKFAADVSSLGDFLALLRLEREFDGTAKLTMDLSGPADAVAAEDIKLNGQLSTGEQLSIDGRIANFSKATGVDITFAADLKRSDGSVPRPSSAFDIELDKITGGATGDILSLTLADLVFSTNLADADLARIGPVSVEKVERDKDGRLALRGLHILSGDPKAPSLDLKGDVLDALNQSGISLAGSFDLDALDLIVGKPAPPEIGRLSGKLAIGDSTGSMRLESLSGQLTGDGPLKLTLDAPPPSDGATSSPLQVELVVADLAALAKAFGAEATGDGSVSFDGSVALDDALEVDGKATIGQSPLTIELKQDVTDGEAVFRGKLGSSGLRLGDLQSLTALEGIGAWFEDGTASAGTADAASSPPDWLDAELDVAATLVADDGAAQAELAAHFVYRDGKVALNPLKIGYAGGTLQASAAVGLGEAAAAGQSRRHGRPVPAGGHRARVRRNAARRRAAQRQAQSAGGRHRNRAAGEVGRRQRAVQDRRRHGRDQPDRPHGRDHRRLAVHQRRPRRARLRRRQHRLQVRQGNGRAAGDRDRQCAAGGGGLVRSRQGQDRHRLHAATVGATADRDRHADPHSRQADRAQDLHRVDRGAGRTGRGRDPDPAAHRRERAGRSRREQRPQALPIRALSFGRQARSASAPGSGSGRPGCARIWGW